MSNRILSRFNVNNRIDVEPFLKCYAISKMDKFKCPERHYLEQIEGFSNMNVRSIRSIADEYRKTYKVDQFVLSQNEDAYLGMFNATITTGKLININEIKEKVIRDGLIKRTIKGVTITPVKVIIRRNKFVPMWEHTSEYGSKNLNKNGKAMSIDFILRLEHNGIVKGASFSIFSKGRVRFSGGSLLGNNRDPELLVDYISNNYKRIDTTDGIKVNNFTSAIKLPLKMNLKLLYTLLDVSEGTSVKFNNKVLRATYEPIRNEFIVKTRLLSKFLYIRFGKDFTIAVAENGSLHIQGNVINESLVKEFIKALKDVGLATQGGGGARNAAPSRPSRVARRFNNLPAPNLLRRGSTCPIKMRPVPYSFQGVCPRGSDYYVRPNPQGQPCCYKKPKRLNYIRNKVAQRYAKAGVRIPLSVRNMFELNNNNTLPNNVSKKNVNVNITNTNSKGILLGSRQCLRYSKQSLMDIAIRLGLKVTIKNTKIEICDMIKKFNSNKYRIPGGGICEHYSKESLLEVAKRFGIGVNNNDTKAQICKKIKIMYNNLNNEPNNIPNSVKRGVRRWRNRSLARDNNYNYFMNLARRIRSGN